MDNLEIISCDDNTVFWRYKGLDGTSLYTDIWAHDAELCDFEFSLTGECSREIRICVSAWLCEQKSI